MWQAYHPKLPWILMLRQQDGSVIMRDTRTGVTARVRSDLELNRFAAEHSAAPGRGGLGDAIRGLTKRLGFGECTPCAKRQALMNARAPRLFRR